LSSKITVIIGKLPPIAVLSINSHPHHSFFLLDQGAGGGGREVAPSGFDKQFQEPSKVV
jgi:hypothetical protein